MYRLFLSLKDYYIYTRLSLIFLCILKFLLRSRYVVFITVVSIHKKWSTYKVKRFDWWYKVWLIFTLVNFTIFKLGYWLWLIRLIYLQILRFLFDKLLTLSIRGSWRRLCSKETSAEQSLERLMTLRALLVSIMNVTTCPTCSAIPTKYPRCSRVSDGK